MLHDGLGPKIFLHRAPTEGLVGLVAPWSNNEIRSNPFCFVDDADVSYIFYVTLLSTDTSKRERESGGGLGTHGDGWCLGCWQYDTVKT